MNKKGEEQIMGLEMNKLVRYIIILSVVAVMIILYIIFQDAAKEIIGSLFK